jgi:glucoamylase
MPRDLPLGNGTLLVAFDARYRLRELYFPRVGLENHTMGRASRIGVRADGRTTWVGDDAWKIDLRYEDDAPVTAVTATEPELGVEIRATDAVDYLRPILLRRFVVKNISPVRREIKIFFHHDFDLLESDAAITAFLDGRTRALIHYKRRRYVLVNVASDGRVGADEFATGARKYLENRGTAGQAEDQGRLDGHPIAQGAVDSTLAVSFDLASDSERSFHVWLATGERYQDVAALQEDLLRDGPEAWIERTRTYGRSWAGADRPAPSPLAEEHARLYRRSLHVIRTQTDHGGAILAANDTDVLAYARDSYSYCWPRDGALVAAALDDSGHPEPAERFFEFCAEHVAEPGYFLHKYNPDGSLASSWHPWVKDGVEQLPIQADETALVLWALERHHARYRDFEFLTPVYHRLVRRAADFLASFRDEETKLPLPSWDLWEERHGVHAFTVGATYGGLMGASRLAETFGDRDAALRWSAAADEIKTAFERYLHHAELGRFVRTGRREAGGYWHDVKVDSSLAGLFLFGMFPADDPRVVRTMQAVEARLSVAGPIGGLARYEDDWFHQVVKGDPTIPGNPWFVCTLWLAEWKAAIAKSEDDLGAATKLLDWAAARALPSGVMAEQLDPISGAPLSVSPLTWSHAAFVSACVRAVARAAEIRAAAAGTQARLASLGDA